jgi:hypothetical protein
MFGWFTDVLKTWLNFNMKLPNSGLVPLFIVAGLKTVGLVYHLVEACILLGCGTTSLGDWCLTFQGDVVLSPSVVEMSKKNEAVVSVYAAGGLRQNVVAEMLEAGYGALVLLSCEESQGTREFSLIDSTLEDETTT